MKYLTPLDLSQNQILNAALQNLAAAPATPVAGQIYFNTATKRAVIWNTVGWIPMDGTDIPEYAVVSSAANGLAPMIGTATGTRFLRDDCTWAAITANNVGLGSVTNNAQMKKIASSTIGFIPTWANTTGDTLATGYSVETTLTGGAAAIPRADAVKTYVDALLAASDAMIFKGTLGTGGTITTLPTAYNAGWTYKIITAGTYAGNVCQVGDMLIALVDRASAGVNADWVVVQTNIDGAVTGPASSVDSNFAAFDATTGKIIKDSGKKAADFAAAAHNHDGTYTKKYTTTVGDAAATSFVITHNLNTRDVAVTLRETAAPYAIVMTDVELTSVNTLTVKFAAAPTSAQYTIAVIG